MNPTTNNALTTTLTTPTPALPEPQRLRVLAHRLLEVDGPRYRRLWAYYRNPMRVVAPDASETGSHRPYRQAQEWGLPSRITGARSLGSPVDTSEPLVNVTRKEVVVENDIAWRVDTMVDALFGKSLVIMSAAPDPTRRAALSELIRLVLAHNGGISFLQQMAMIGSVYGFVDVLVKLDPSHADTSHATPCGTSDLGRPPVCDEVEDASQEHSQPSADASPPSATHVSHPPVTGSARGEVQDQENTDRGEALTASPDASDLLQRLSRVARMIRLELVEPARALPVLSPTDVRTVEAYAQVYRSFRKHLPRRPVRTYKTRWIDRVRRSAVGLLGARDPEVQPLVAEQDDQVLVVDVITPTRWARYEDERLVASGANSLGQLPLVHVQNVAEAFAYEGASDVEPLIPLQDELNTRLSDRANRITLQSFKMYLGKNVEGFGTMPVAPGRMWTSDDMSADIVEFGGDAACPSEESHIADVREALDKTSGVTPIAAGAIKGRIGRLTSAAALRVTLQALLNRTEKKRTTYGAAIERMCELALAWLDAAGVFKTTPDERRIEIHWPSPIPQNESELLEQAQAKLRVGVPQDVVLRELGY
jgi:hypothetical protein